MDLESGGHVWFAGVVVAWKFLQLSGAMYKLSDDFKAATSTIKKLEQEAQQRESKVDTSASGMFEETLIKDIGVISGCYKQCIGTPRQGMFG
jgi:hypothetical protein